MMVAYNSWTVVECVEWATENAKPENASQGSGEVGVD